jgi:hypothetical protein
MALHVLLFFGTTPLGAPLIGWTAEHFGARASIWLGGLGSLAAALLVGAVQLRRARARVLVHLRPRPHLHVTEAGRDGVPPLELRMPELPAPRLPGPKPQASKLPAGVG